MGCIVAGVGGGGGGGVLERGVMGGGDVVARVGWPRRKGIEGGGSPKC